MLLNADFVEHRHVVLLVRRSRTPLAVLELVLRDPARERSDLLLGLARETALAHLMAVGDATENVRGVFGFFALADVRAAREGWNLGRNHAHRGTLVSVLRGVHSVHSLGA